MASSSKWSPRPTPFANSQSFFQEIPGHASKWRLACGVRSHARDPGRTVCDAVRPYLATDSSLPGKPFSSLLSPEHLRAKRRKGTQGGQSQVDLQGLPRAPGLPRLRVGDSGAVRDLGWVDRDRTSPTAHEICRVTVRPSPRRAVQPAASSHSSNGTAWRLVRPKCSRKIDTVKPSGSSTIRAVISFNWVGR